MTVAASRAQAIQLSNEDSGVTVIDPDCSIVGVGAGKNTKIHQQDPTNPSKALHPVSGLEEGFTDAADPTDDNIYTFERIERREGLFSRYEGVISSLVKNPSKFIDDFVKGEESHRLRYTTRYRNDYICEVILSGDNMGSCRGLGRAEEKVRA